MFTNHSRTKNRSQCVKSEETAGTRRKALRRLAAKIPTRSSMDRQGVDDDETSKLARSSTRLTVGDMAANRIEDDEILTVRQVSKLLKTPPENDLQACPEWQDSGAAARKKLAVFEGGDNEVFRKKGCLAARNQKRKSKIYLINLSLDCEAIAINLFIFSSRPHHTASFISPRSSHGRSE